MFMLDLDQAQAREGAPTRRYVTATACRLSTSWRRRSDAGVAASVRWATCSNASLDQNRWPAKLAPGSGADIGVSKIAPVLVSW